MKGKNTDLTAYILSGWLFAVTFGLIIPNIKTYPVYASGPAPINYKQNDLNIAQLSDRSGFVLGDFNTSQINNLAAVLSERSTNTPTIIPLFPNDNKEYGVWVWTSPIKMSENRMKGIVALASMEGINVVYLTTDDYLEINQSDSTKKNDYSAALEKFIKLAATQNISVDIEGGRMNWAEPENQDKTLLLVNFAIEYNKTHSQKIRGFQYDIEPYLLPNFIVNEDEILGNFISLIDKTATKLKGSNIRLAITIPHFYDRSSSWTPMITYSGKNLYTYDHLLNILDKSPNSSLIIMAYRNFASGKNGAIDISENEIDEASQAVHSTKIIVAQELGKIDPPYISFYQKTKNYLGEQLGLIENAFGEERAFGGLALHYIDPLADIK